MCIRFSWFFLLIHDVSYIIMHANMRKSDTDVHCKKKFTFELRQLLFTYGKSVMKRILIRKMGILCMTDSLKFFSSRYFALFCVCERSHFHSLIASSSMTGISNVFRRHRFSLAYAVILFCNFISCLICYFD